jgi:hypothetical protein
VPEADDSAQRWSISRGQSPYGHASGHSGKSKPSRGVAIWNETAAPFTRDGCCAQGWGNPFILHDTPQPWRSTRCRFPFFRYHRESVDEDVVVEGWLIPRLETSEAIAGTLVPCIHCGESQDDPGSDRRSPAPRSGLEAKDESVKASVNRSTIKSRKILIRRPRLSSVRTIVGPKVAQEAAQKM